MQRYLANNGQQWLFLCHVLQDPDHRFLILSIKFTMKEGGESMVHAFIDHSVIRPSRNCLCFFPGFFVFSSPLVSSLSSLFFLFSEGGFSWMGCSRVISCWLSFANAQMTPQLAALACHSLAVLSPRFRAQSKLLFQPRLRSSATAMIHCCCWRLAGLVTSYKAIHNQVSVILIISHHQPA